MLKSNALPGVFGVFDPNDAKAPEPRPNAVEPPALGDAVVVALRGPLALKGLFLVDDILPKRFGPGEWVP